MLPSLLLNFTFKKYVRIQEHHEFVIVLFIIVAMVIGGCFKFRVHNGWFYAYVKMWVFLIVRKSVDIIV